ncbi:DUF368 domain-containing protein [Kocuria sp.]|uniref:DUF368 domain-containing protein n=1 Tax=Kocuria sp. TaxID=1871328 RepID=UPI0026E03743|nr:DUF368 domain-containing protein [Kocuria sp.]MDO5618086.1 DUF368 domain-containing protein [Kocuria sp.]
MSHPAPHLAAEEGALAPTRKTSIPGNLVRGAMIGTVETVPGVSGGTVALVVGIYDQLIGSASEVISAFRALLLGPDRAPGFKKHMANVHWRVVIPVVIGMVAALLLVAGPMEHLVDTHPELMRAIFFGMVVGSLWVPLSLAGRGWTWADWLLGIGAAVVAFFLVSIPATTLEPQPWIIILAAAVAVSALLLPGLSGSFILLTIGLYQPTLRAVDNLDFGYLGLFFLGAVLGMIVIVKALQKLLEHHHRGTMIALVGLMIGALRSLWPWQDDERNLHAPAADWPVLLMAGLAGLIVVAILLVVDNRIAARRN